MELHRRINNSLWASLSGLISSGRISDPTHTRRVLRGIAKAILQRNSAASRKSDVGQFFFFFFFFFHYVGEMGVPGPELKMMSIIHDLRVRPSRTKIPSILRSIPPVNDAR
jgi:hypothetical protein